MSEFAECSPNDSWRAPFSAVACATFLVLLALVGKAIAGSGEPDLRTIPAIAAVLEKGSARAQQKAFASLGTRPGAEADRLLLAQFDRYLAGALPPALWLELLEAAAKRDSAGLKARLAAHEREAAHSRDPLSRYRECLEGGDAAAGREIFTKKPEAGCIRCHRVEGEGGEIGPDLTALRQVTDRVFILESIIDPNAVITSGFQNFLFTLKNGETLSGIVNLESSEELVVTSVVDGRKRTLKLADIAGRMPLPSAMPPGFGLTLGKRALRDLVEFLATIDQP
ncbi:MAG TPA: c-type cytochrome [Chthoniobacteraceae bacterium]|nr:c-type cytochrome [Chthoniobacteraceae bacterium]